MRETIRLGDLCTVVSGTTPKTGNDEYWDGDILWVTPAELTEESFIINDTVRKITDKAVKESGLKSFPKGTVLLSSRAPIGKVAIAGREMYCNQGFKNFICNDELKNEYLYWFLKGKTEYLNSLGRGATFKEISKSIVENILIPLPDWDNQIHISTVLSKCQAVIKLRKEQIKQLDDLIKSRFVEMFGDPLTNPMGWEEVVITELCEKICGGGTPSKSHPEYFEGHIPWVSPKDMKSMVIRDSQDHITEEAIENSSTNIIPENSVLMVIRSGILKHTLPVAINAVPVTINQDMKAFVPGKKIHSAFLMNYFKAVEPNVLSGVRGVTADNIDFKDFQKRMVILPPIDLQKQYATFVKQVDKLKVEVLKSLDETQWLFDSLMQKYFD